MQSRCIKYRWHSFKKMRRSLSLWRERRRRNRQNNGSVYAADHGRRADGAMGFRLAGKRGHQQKNGNQGQDHPCGHFSGIHRNASFFRNVNRALKSSFHYIRRMKPGFCFIFCKNFLIKLKRLTSGRHFVA